jgi:hypothetical protein
MVEAPPPRSPSSRDERWGRGVSPPRSELRRRRQVAEAKAAPVLVELEGGFEVAVPLLIVPLLPEWIQAPKTHGKVGCQHACMHGAVLVAPWLTWWRVRRVTLPYVWQGSEDFLLKHDRTSADFRVSACLGGCVVHVF